MNMDVNNTETVVINFSLTQMYETIHQANTVFLRYTHQPHLYARWQFRTQVNCTVVQYDSTIGVDPIKRHELAWFSLGSIDVWIKS